MTEPTTSASVAPERGHANVPGLQQLCDVKLGRFYGLGVGPGDPELLTLKAHRLLTQAAVVCVPSRGTSYDSYGFSIVKQYVDPDRQEILKLTFPMKKDRNLLIPFWDAAVAEVMQRLRQGKDAVFITEGDPFLYSTFIYMHDTFRQRHPEVQVEVVPGVTSVSAVCARVGLPLADRDDRIAILPATYEGENLRQVLETFEAVALMKVNSVFDRVLDLLEEMGLVGHAVWVKRCGTPDEEIERDVRKLRGKRLDYMSMVVVRK